MQTCGMHEPPTAGSARPTRLMNNASQPNRYEHMLIKESDNLSLRKAGENFYRDCAE